MRAFARRIGPGDPLLLVQPDGVDDERVAVPAPSRMAQVCRPELGRRWMFSTVHVDDSPRMRSGDVEEVDLLLVGDVHDLESWRVEEAGTRRRLAPDQRRIEIVL